MSGQLKPSSGEATDQMRRAVQRIFEIFEGRYGKRWAENWGGVDLPKAIEQWCTDLRGYSIHEIAKGVERAKTLEWPPSLPQFLKLCRPPIDPEEALVEAVTQMSRREEGADQWSHPAIFWAAATIGAFDLKNQSRDQLLRRWKQVFEAEMAKGEWQAIPPRREALPDLTPFDPSAKPRKMPDLSGLKNPRRRLEWAKSLREQWLKGAELLPVQTAYASAALRERWFLDGSKRKTCANAPRIDDQEPA